MAKIFLLSFSAAEMIFRRIFCKTFLPQRFFAKFFCRKTLQKRKKATRRDRLLTCVKILERMKRAKSFHLVFFIRLSIALQLNFSIIFPLLQEQLHYIILQFGNRGVGAGSDVCLSLPVSSPALEIRFEVNDLNFAYAKPRISQTVVRQLL